MKTKMKELILFLKSLFSLVSNVKQLEKDVENLETKVLAPEDTSEFTTGLMEQMWTMYFTEPSREMALEEKVNAIARLLKIDFEWTEEQEKVLVAKLPKKARKPRKKRGN